MKSTWMVLVDEDGVRIQEHRRDLPAQTHQYIPLPETLGEIESWADAQGFEMISWEFPPDMQSGAAIMLVADLHEKFGL